MPLPSSGPISASQIQTEYGGSNPMSISEYYRGGANVPIETTAGPNGLIPTAGTIRYSHFYTKGKFIFNATISANTSDYNIATAAAAAGWDGSETLIATITINSGIYVSASSTSVHALDTGSSFPGGHSISIINNGLIVGRGGAGGTGGSTNASSPLAAGAGGAGGPALRAQVAISVTNNGTIGGGGGGGGGGASLWDSDKGGSTWGVSGGGGGGGRVNGTAGARGTAAGTTYISNTGANGTAGSLTGAGAGGGGSTLPGYTGGNGGAGGGLGTAGSSGGAAFGSLSLGAAGAGGAAGAAVVGNANISWVVTGTRLGALT